MPPKMKAISSMQMQLRLAQQATATDDRISLCGGSPEQETALGMSRGPCFRLIKTLENPLEEKKKNCCSRRYSDGVTLLCQPPKMQPNWIFICEKIFTRKKTWGRKKQHWIEFSVNSFTSREIREGKYRYSCSQLSVMTLYCQNGPFYRDSPSLRAYHFHYEKRKIQHVSL